MGPPVKGAVAASTVGLAILLIAAPGPLAALTLASATGAIGTALAQLVAAAGAGALLGKPTGRLLAVVGERLIGSIELDAAYGAAAAFRALLESFGRQRVHECAAEASALVLDREDPLARALESLRGASEGPR